MGKPNLQILKIGEMPFASRGRWFNHKNVSIFKFAIFLGSIGSPCILYAGGATGNPCLIAQGQERRACSGLKSAIDQVGEAYSRVSQEQLAAEQKQNKAQPALVETNYNLNQLIAKLKRSQEKNSTLSRKVASMEKAWSTVEEKINLIQVALRSNTCSGVMAAQSADEAVSAYQANYQAGNDGILNSPDLEFPVHEYLQEKDLEKNRYPVASNPNEYKPAFIETSVLQNALNALNGAIASCESAVLESESEFNCSSVSREWLAAGQSQETGGNQALADAEQTNKRTQDVILKIDKAYQEVESTLAASDPELQKLRSQLEAAKSAKLISDKRISDARASNSGISVYARSTLSKSCDSRDASLAAAQKPAATSDNTNWGDSSLIGEVMPGATDQVTYWDKTPTINPTEFQNAISRVENGKVVMPGVVAVEDQWQGWKPDTPDWTTTVIPGDDGTRFEPPSVSPPATPPGVTPPPAPAPAPGPKGPVVTQPRTTPPEGSPPSRDQPAKNSPMSLPNIAGIMPQQPPSPPMEQPRPPEIPDEVAGMHKTPEFERKDRNKGNRGESEVAGDTSDNLINTVKNQLGKMADAVFGKGNSFLTAAAPVGGASGIKASGNKQAASDKKQRGKPKSGLADEPWGHMGTTASAAAKQQAAARKQQARAGQRLPSQAGGQALADAPIDYNRFLPKLERRPDGSMQKIVGVQGNARHRELAGPYESLFRNGSRPWMKIGPEIDRYLRLGKQQAARLSGL